PRVEQLVHGGRRTAHLLQLAEGERQQREHRGAASQALRDGRHELELTRSGHDEAAHPWVGIDDALEVREQLRRALCLVDDGAVRDLPQEGSWVLEREGAGVWVL